MNAEEETSNASSKSSAPSFDFELHPTRSVPKWKVKYPIKRSTAVSFDPDTVFIAVVGRDLHGLLKQNHYASYRVMLAWLASLEGGSRMQKATQLAFEKLMTPRRDEISRPPSIDELKSMPLSLSSPWRLLFRTVRRERGPLLRRLLVRLAWGDRSMHRLSCLDNATATERKSQLFFSGFQYWYDVGFVADANPWEAIVLDETLGHLAWADIYLSQKLGAIDPVLFLAAPDAVPMRHWFDCILRTTGSSNLNELCDFLAARVDRDSTRHITHLELRQWATEKKPLPEKIANQIMATLVSENETEAALLRHQLWGARLLNFLISFAQGFSKTTVNEKVAQELIFTRLQQRKASFMGDSGVQSSSVSP